MFSGFSGLALYIIPTLKQEAVANRVYKALMSNEMEVYIPSFIFWLGTVMVIIRGFSEDLKNFINQKFMGDSMKNMADN